MVHFCTFSAAAAISVAAATAVAQGSSYTVPFASGSGDWAAAYKKATAVVATLTLEEKLNLTVQDPGGVPRIGYPGIVYCDGPNGPNNFAGHSAVPAALHAASTFDRQLIHDRARIIGRETYLAGCHALAAPMVNVARAAAAGRNFEGFGPDPYLMGEMAAAAVAGVQSEGVMALAKHFALNNQEHGRHYSSSDVDDRAFREIYLPGFEESVRAGVGSVMCAYNAINGTLACENPQTLGRILKDELGFQGWVVTDYSATNSTPAAFNAGSDVIMGSILFRPYHSNSTTFATVPGFGTDLLPFLANDTITLARLNDAAIRVLSTWYQYDLGNADRPPPATQFYSLTAANDWRDVRAGTSRAKLREIGAAGTVVLKNEGGALPLAKPRAVAVFGLDAGADRYGLNVQTAGASANGTVAMGWGSGFLKFPYLVTPLDALTARAIEDGTYIQSVTDNWDLDLIDSLASLAYNDACLVFVNANSGEELESVDGNLGDRNNLTAWSRGDALVEQVAGNCSNTIIVAHSTGALLMPWRAHPNVSAIVWGGLPGQESGNALVDVLYGEVNPSGRLAYTLPKRREDLGADVDYGTETWTGELYHIQYNESYYLDYRHFQAKNIEPLYPFGFGLSYTSFAYSGLKVAAASKRFRRTSGSTSTKSTPYPDSLYDTLYTVTVTVENMGKLDGHEVAQLYVKLSSEAEADFKQLKGFERPLIKAGKSATVTFELRKRDIVYWSVEKQQWVLPKSFEVYAGSSSADLKLSKRITL